MVFLVLMYSELHIVFYMSVLLLPNVGEKMSDRSGYQYRRLHVGRRMMDNGGG